MLKLGDLRALQLYEALLAEANSLAPMKLCLQLLNSLLLLLILAFED